jgi:hypothetical protein
MREAHIDAVIARCIRAFPNKQRLQPREEVRIGLEENAQIENEMHYKATTHPPDVKGTNVERAQTPSGPILVPSTMGAECRINAKRM